MSQDDDRIAALFRDAAADAPPAGFGHDQVLADSRRITARRRSAVIGTAAALVVVAGAAIGIGVVRTEQTADSAAMPSSASAESAPGAADTLDGPAAAARAPLGPSPSECGGGQDPDLRALVDAALPEVAGAPEAATTQQCRPQGERNTALEVVDDGVTGLLSVTYLPPGAAVSVTPDGTAATAGTASGGSVVVTVRGEQGGDAPFADEVQAVADSLAPQL